MVYIITIISSVFFAWLASRAKNRSVMILCSIISVLIPAVVGGLRDRVGTDTMVYGIPNAMEAYASKSFLDFMLTKREPGYGLLCYVTMKTLGHPNWCLFFYQLITVGCFYIGAYKHRKIASLPLTMLCFLCMFYISSFNVIRQSMAASIIFMGINNLEEKKYWRFMAYVMAAFMFHFSSVAVVVLILGVHLFITNQSSHFKYFVVGSIIIFLIFIRPIATVVMQLTQSLDIVPARYINYMDTSDQYGLTSSNAFSRVMITFQIGVLLMLTFYYQGARKILGKYNVDFYRLNFLICLILHYVVRFFFRLILFNDFVNVILYTSMPHFVKNKHMKFMLTSIVIITVVFCWVNGYLIKAWSVWAYRSVL